MRITMKTLSAHPDGTLEIGQTYEVPGQCSKERAQDLLDGGYAVLTDEDPATAERAEPAAADDDKPLEKRTVEQLKAYAAEREIELGDASKKAEILDKITTELERREAEDED
ncbi:hypothetical protein ACIP96_06360 [Streptomyces nigra]|uniref:hypothetical protein n=1 Tax=Streptomyces nigra TaxID=1827580 RepID=UPI00382CCA0C